MKSGWLVGMCVTALVLALAPTVSAQQVVQQNGDRMRMIGIPAGQVTPSSGATTPENIGVFPTIQAAEAMRNQPAKSNVPAAPVCETGFGIDYHCGPVMNQGINTYVFFYGDWRFYNWPIILNFLDNLGGSPYFNINTSYDDGQGNNILNFVSRNYDGLTYVDDSGNPVYARGFNLSFADISAIVNDAIASGLWGDYDDNGIYLVLTDPFVSQSNGGSSFCTAYCGWHTSFPNPNDGNPIAYGFIGDPVLQCPRGCEPFGGGNAPNGDEGTDAMVSVIAHEIDEATADPDAVGGWYRGDTAHENGDLCNFNFGPTYFTANGSLANQNFGGLDYLVQQNWLNVSPGGCAQGW